MTAVRLAVLAVLAAPALAADPAPVKVNDLSAVPPADWKAEKPSNRLRSHQFRLPSGEKDVPDAEVSVYPESSPDVKKGHERWLATFVPPEGKTIEEASTVTKVAVAGAKAVTVLDVTGTWKYKERPQDPKSKEELRAEWRVVWVIVEGREESAHVRLAGPAAVVEKHKKGFDGWLAGLK
jgi:hypothetical protein